MKTLEQVKSDEKIGEVYTFTKFMSYIVDRYITSYDGSGSFHNGDNKTDVCVDPDELYDILEMDCFNSGIDIDDVDGDDIEDGTYELPKELKELENKYPYVIWYNR